MEGQNSEIYPEDFKSQKKLRYIQDKSQSQKVAVSSTHSIFPKFLSFAK
jgi:hypothetical protein